ncbi:MAG: hypothetical protein NTY48_07290 [Candidatus Diapherotrites archaeon]|nr:hypothetical protein [Candidatus Diapherotrites archaeon]
MSSGQITQEIETGSYTYSAYTKGFTTNDSFTVEAGRTKDVLVYFSDLNSDTNALVNSTQTKRLYFKVMDNNSELLMAEARVFKKSGNDWNFYNSYSPQLSNIFGPMPILDSNSVFKVIIKAPNHISQIVDLQLVMGNAPPQQIVLQRGGAQLTLKVVDDVNHPVAGAITKLYLNGFLKEFEIAKATDVNGVRVIDGLPDGSYKATAETSIDYGEVNLNSSGSKSTQIILLTTGTGVLRLHFSSISGNESPAFIVQTRNGGNFANEYTAKATNGFATTKSFKALTQVRVIVNDGNFLPSEGLVYTIKRGTQDLYIFLYKQGDLPNQNPVQLILRKISLTNPLNSEEAGPITKLMPDQNYFFLFDLILNSDTIADASAAFLTAGESTDNSLGMLIQGVGAFDNAIYSFHNKNTGFVDFELNRISSDQIPVNAVHALVEDSILKGPVVVPVILNISIDANASGKKYDLNWAARSGDTTSILYSKEFIVGSNFCFVDCPAFGFDSYLSYLSTNPLVINKPIDDSIQKIQIGDSYAIKTKVTNFSDKDYGNGILTLLIKNPVQNLQYLSFDPDTNAVYSDVTMAPFTIVNSLQKYLNAKKSSGVIQINEKIISRLENPGVFEELKGNGDDYLRFSVMNKQNLLLEAYATGDRNVIYEKTNYPIIFIQVKAVDSVTKIQKAITGGYWWAYKEGDNTKFTLSGNAMQPLDENGRALFSLNAANIASGTKIIFEAMDFDNSNPARTEITVSKRPFDIAQVTDCLSVKIAGNNIRELSLPEIDINLRGVPVTNSLISVDSNCTTERIISISSAIQGQSQLPFSFSLSDEGPADYFTIQPGEINKVITVSDFAKGISEGRAMYGVNPIVIIATGGINPEPNQIAAIDIVLTDLNADFVLSKYTFDFSKNRIVSAGITNNKFVARKDIWHPKVNIDEPVMYVDLTNLAVPDIVTFPVTIDTKGVEATLFAYDLGQIIHAMQYGGNCAAYPPTVSIEPVASSTDLKFLQDGYDSFIAFQSWFSRANSTLITVDSNEHAKRPFLSLPQNIKDNIKIFQSGNKPSPNPVLVAKTPTIDYTLSAQNNALGIMLGNTYQTYPLGGGGWAPIEKDNSGVVTNSKFNLGVLNNSEKIIGTSKIKDINENEKVNLEGINENEKVNKISFGCGQIHTANAQIQHELLRVALYENERSFSTTKTIKFKPMEDVVYCDPVKYDSSLSPVWGTNVLNPTILGHLPSEEWIDSTNNALIKNIGRLDLGFVPLDYALSGTPNNPVAYPRPRVDDPTVEYKNSGKIVSKIQTNTIPQNTRVFLNNGQVCAEYLGDLDSTSRDKIDFNVVRTDPVDSGYTTITVEDWASNSSTPVTQQFRVKIIGSQTNCISEDGISGITGGEAMPRVLYNWDWDKVSENQCESTNTKYTYCDAAQFNISLFKKLPRINEALLLGNGKIIPSMTSYYSYLMKDNYTPELLADFDEYYSSQLLSGANNNFKDNYDQLIVDGKIKFKLKDDLGIHDLDLDGLPKAGLYHVEINFNFDNLNSPQIMKPEGTGALVTIIFSLVREAGVNSLLYELPFDGDLGRNLDASVRSNYGSGPKSGQLVLDNNGLTIISSVPQSGGLNPFTLIMDMNLAVLNEQKVLLYDATTHTLKLSPSQPTPIGLGVGSINGTATAKYTLTGFNASTSLLKNWTLLGSTILNGRACRNFWSSNQSAFTEAIGASQNSRILNWENAHDGNITLGTVFFTPPIGAGGAVSTTLIPNIGSFETLLLPNGYSLINGGRLILLYYDRGGIQNYDTLNGIFSQIKDQKMCISNNEDGKVTVWWNPLYIDTLKRQLPIGQGQQKC